MLLEPFRVCVALGPLVGYCLVLGRIHLLGSPLLTTGSRDLTALGIAASGLVMVGPMELFLPESAAIHFGSAVWLLLGAFYGFGIILWVLLSRPRLVVYNCTSDQFKPILVATAAKIDPAARWAGESLSMPGIGVELYLDSSPLGRTVTLVASVEQQNLDGWQTLEHSLAEQIDNISAARSWLGGCLIAIGLALLGACVGHMFSDPTALAQGWRDMLRF